MLSMNTLQQAPNSSAHATQLPGHRPHCLCHPVAHRGSKEHLLLDPTQSWCIRLGASRESACQDCVAICKTIQQQLVPSYSTLHLIMAKQNNFQCSWTKFFTKAMNQLTILHAAKYPSHAKITKFLNAANHHFKHHVKSHNRGRSYKNSLEE